MPEACASWAAQAQRMKRADSLFGQANLTVDLQNEEIPGSTAYAVEGGGSWERQVDRPRPRDGRAWREEDRLRPYGSIHAHSTLLFDVGSDALVQSVAAEHIRVTLRLNQFPVSVARALSSPIDPTVSRSGNRVER